MRSRTYKNKFIRKGRVYDYGIFNKEKVLASTLVSASVLALAACGSDDEGTNTGSTDNADKEESSTLVVGASNTPHAIILEQVEPILEEQGIDLEIETYQDYILPNQDLEGKRN